MKSLGPLQLETLRYYTSIAAAKQEPRRERLLNLAAFVQRRYGAYDDRTRNLAPLERNPITLEQKQDLIHCYESPTDALNGLKRDIGLYHNTNCPSIAALCQYCGLSYDASDFDHYLPKELFPEYSVLSINLVPCCGRCNGLKDTTWVDAEGHRRIVSFYYDELPDRRFLFADIEVENTADFVPSARFRLSTNVVDYCGLMETIQSHYEQLELLARYRHAASTVFGDKKIELGPVVEHLGPAEASNMLRENAENLSRSRSPNYWEVALLYGMSDSAEYLNSLA